MDSLKIKPNYAALGREYKLDWDWIVGQVQNLAKSLLQVAKNVLGIHSPWLRILDLR